MELVEILKYKLQEAYMRGPVSFIVMNTFTAHTLMGEIIGINPPSTMKLSKYEDLEVLISESLNNYEFRLG